ncbi:LuxR C-terminal-related transcriptional regulator [Paraburkholderia sp. D1E]|uniref:LuxR C-terminal-related transcriptional regulator n=1 Tax=Paraburkholderia sp. D1E TaxID=3461398 RepID=UPI004046066F
MCAPAGFGKTTLLGQYYESLKQQGVASAWLRIDADDADPKRFFTYLAAAFWQIDPTSEPLTTGQSLFDANAVIGDLVLALTESMTAYHDCFALFIDEFEHIRDAETLEHLRKMIKDLPANAQLVIGSRSVPDVGLARLRANGRLLEIGSENIRFSLQETTVFLLDKKRLSLGESEIGELQKRTEGWASALQLASLSLAGRTDAGHFIRSFSGAHANIADYLAEDVLAHQPEETRQFLLRTSILDQLSAPLCDAVLGRNNSQELLAHLERENLFVLPLDTTRYQYRYHSLFGAFLRGRLAVLYPDDVPRLHFLASEWYLTQAMVVQAIDHALAAGQTKFALSLLSTHANRLLREGRFRLLCRWLGALPTGLLDEFPRLRIAYAWAMMFLRQYEQANALLDALFEGAIGSSLDGDLHSEIAALRAVILLRTDHVEQCYRLAMQSTPSVATHTFAEAWLATILAYSQIKDRRFREAQQALDIAMQQHSELGSIFGMTYTQCGYGIINLARGRLRNAIASNRQAYEIATKERDHMTGSKAGAAVFLAEAFYEAGQLDEAERLLIASIQIATEIGFPDLLISSHILLARIAHNRSQGERSLKLLADLEQLGHHGGLPRLVATAWLERSRLALLDGQLNTAKEYIQYAGNPQAWPQFGGRQMWTTDIESLDISRVRLLIYRGDAENALNQIKMLIQRAEEDGHVRRVMKLKILNALALSRCFEEGSAMQVLTEVLHMASRDGFIQIFIEEGPAVASLIRNLRDRLGNDEGGVSDCVPTAFFAEILSAFGSMSTEGTLIQRAASSETKEVLTEREVLVLRLLVDGNRNRVIAEKLFISEATVKFHLRNINAKLGANNRTQAIAIARSAGLIS